MDKYIVCLGEVPFISTLDTDGGYWQVKIFYKDKEKGAFTPQCALYRFEQMKFELRNATSTFQRAANSALLAGKCHLALFFHDNIAVFPRSAS